MRQKECIAMILAGGNGSRLGSLTNDVAKPLVYYGGRYRIIDFTLSNCTHSGMDTIGVLTQYRPLDFCNYIEHGEAWNLDIAGGGVFMLSSFSIGNFYAGTADAVFQNIAFIEQFNPKYVLILSGDHVYKMDYSKMLNFHKKTGADATVAVTCVPLKDASRFGLVNTIKNGSIIEFEEKPMKPKSNLASMGIYIFKWSRLKKFLVANGVKTTPQIDFGKDIIPSMLSAGEKLYAYQFDNYWRDVGTIQSLWESNMDLVADTPIFDLHDKKWEIFTKTPCRPPCQISDKTKVKKSITNESCSIYGKVERSVLFDSVTVCEGAEVIDSVVMPGTVIGENAKIHKSVIGDNVYIGENTEIGADDGLSIYFDNELCTNDISLIGPGVCVARNIKFRKNSYIDNSLLPSRKRQTQAVFKERPYLDVMLKEKLMSGQVH